MRCPKCLKETLNKFVDVTFCVSVGTANLSKSAIRKSEVKLVCANWDGARYYCANCGWFMRGDRAADKEEK